MLVLQPFRAFLACFLIGEAAIGVACAPPPLNRAPEPSTIAIEHATVIPMDTERVFPDHTIIVRGNTIESVVPSASANIPRGALRVDGRGLYAIPGIADMHVHLYDTDGFPSYLAYGITTIFNMHGSPPDLRWREALRRGTLDGPTLYTASPSVNGYPPGNPLFISIQDSAEGQPTARDLKAAGYDAIKVYGFLNPDVYTSLLAEAHRAGITVVGHIPLQVGYAQAVAAGQSNIAHIEEFFQNGDVPDDSISAVARTVRASGATVTANLFAYADYIRTIADPAAVVADPEMRYASPALYSEKIPTSNRATNRPDPAGFSRFLAERRLRFGKLLRALHADGVPILVGTDTEIFGFPGQSAQEELAELVAAGMSPYEALVAGTRNAGEFVAKHIHPNDRFGILAKGMRADVVLLRANPLTDIRAAQAISGVMVRGRWYSGQELRKMRDSIASLTAPQRRFVYAFDSLMMKEKNVGAAATLLRQFHSTNPAAVPLAELVWIGYGRMLYQKDRANSIEIRRMAVEVYPESFSARNQMGRGYLFAGDTTRALQYFNESLALEPHNLVVRDMIARLEATRTPPSADPVGTYVIEPFRMRVQGKPLLASLVITVARAGSRYSAQVKINSDTAVTATEVIAGGNRMWINAPIGGADLELQLILSTNSVEGTWVLGWVNNGRLRGTRSAPATAR